MMLRFDIKQIFRIKKCKKYLKYFFKCSLQNYIFKKVKMFGFTLFYNTPT